MLRISGRSRRGAKEESSSAHTLSATIGVSVLAHAVAIGALLAFKPVQYPAPPPDTIEISIEPDQPLAGPQAPRPSPVYPKVTATALTPSWSRADHSFDMSALPTFRQHTHDLAFDALAAVLNCLSVGDSAGRELGRSRRADPPCASEYPLLRAPVMRGLPADALQLSENRADSDYRKFKPIQPLFDESLLPQEVPPANRALKNWIARLLQ